MQNNSQTVKKLNNDDHFIAWLSQRTASNEQNNKCYIIFTYLNDVMKVEEINYFDLNQPNNNILAIALKQFRNHFIGINYNFEKEMDIISHKHNNSIRLIAKYPEKMSANKTAITLLFSKLV